jgi:hypothetical protein
MRTGREKVYLGICLKLSSILSPPAPRIRNSFVSTREHRPEYLYFSPTRLSLAGVAGAIAKAAISGIAVIQVWPPIDTFAQRLRTTAIVAAIESERVYAVPEPAVTARTATSSNSTHSTSSDTTGASIPDIGSLSNAQAVNSQIPPIDRRLKGAAFWAAQKARVEAITALVHERWARTAKDAESDLGLHAASVGNRIDVRPNWKEKPGIPDSWEGRPAWE